MLDTRVLILSYFVLPTAVLQLSKNNFTKNQVSSSENDWVIAFLVFVTALQHLSIGVQIIPNLHFVLTCYMQNKWFMAILVFLTDVDSCVDSFNYTWPGRPVDSVYQFFIGKKGGIYPLTFSKIGGKKRSI